VKAALPKPTSTFLKRRATPIQLTVALDKSATPPRLSFLRKAAASAPPGQMAPSIHLNIPEKALPSATPITLTAVSSLTGLPFGGKVYAVQMAPKGWYTTRNAFSRSRPTTPIPWPSRFSLPTRPAGKALAWLPGGEIKGTQNPQLMHFSGYGVAEGTSADVATVQAQLGGDPVPP